MRITPSPRILKMLGQIEFAEWQCLAELIDNSIDALRQAAVSREYDLSPEDYCIEVYLPESQNDLDATVEVKDHAPGMNTDKLQQAVKAGWSGNDQFDHLGLFGMGFNVATARLGRITRVITTQRSESSWVGVEIDLDNIEEDFEAADLDLPKEDPELHGTSVIISSLDADRANMLAKRHNAIRMKLGHVYSWILTETKIKLRVNGRLVAPKRLCAWGEDRSVTRGSGQSAEDIPAVIPIDEELGEADACSDCGNWQNTGKDKCDSCGSENINARQRRIHGWVGIQRYLHPNEYGMDFLRNGRKIVTFDKDVFSWIDPNNPLAVSESEYPVEVPADQGRIIGEIHIDHVPVHYMKDRFNTADRSWKSAIEFLRGPGPLKPQRAKQLNYPQNDSPIGRLFRGYRRNDPGYSYLVPGDGTRAINQQVQEWGAWFGRGDGVYQDDKKWWDAVVFHEQQKALKNAPTSPPDDEADVDAVMRALQGSEAVDDDETPDVEGSSSNQEERPLTIHDKVQNLLRDARAYPTLTREVHSRSLSESLNVRAYEVAESPLLDGNNDAHTAVWLSPAEGGAVNLFVDANHESFTEHGVEVLDMAIAQIAHFMLTRSNSTEHSISQIMYELRRENFPDEKADFVTVQNSSRDLMNHIKSRLVNFVAEDCHRAWGLLSSEEIAQMESRAVLSGRPGQSIDSSDPAFIEEVPALFLLTLFDDWPAIFLDEKVFRSKYNQLQDGAAKQMCKSRIASLLIDAAAIAAEEKTPASLNQLKRARLAVEILQSEMDY